MDDSVPLALAGRQKGKPRLCPSPLRSTIPGPGAGEVSTAWMPHGPGTAALGRHGGLSVRPQRDEQLEKQ